MSSSDWRNGEEPDRPGPDPGEETVEVVFMRDDGYLSLRELGTKNYVAGFTVDPAELP